MQGVTIGYQRVPTKKALREAVASNPARVNLEATSMFGNEYDGSLADAPAGNYYVVGPHPANKRSWYAHIVVGRDGSIKVS